jgi:hypothetical protein
MPAAADNSLLLAGEFADAFADERSCCHFEGRHNEGCKKGELGFRSLGGKGQTRRGGHMSNGCAKKSNATILELKQLLASLGSERELVGGFHV